jgi:proline iminopeptidase
MHTQFHKASCFLFLILALTSCGEDAKETTQESINIQPTAPTFQGVINASEEGFVVIGGDSIFYRSIGNGDPIIIVHGGPGLNHTYLLPQMAELANRHQLIFYDQRASGYSTMTADSSTISVNSFVDDIEAIRKHFNIEKLNLLGHSWGGLLAMKYAIKYTDQLQSLVLLNAMSASSELKVKEDEKLNERITEEDRNTIKAITTTEEFSKGNPRAYEQLFREFFRREFSNKLLADELTMSFEDNFQEGSAALQHLGKDLENYDFHEELKTISCPTLIVYGDYEVLVEESGPMIQKHIPNSEYVVLENCGHFPYIEAKEELFPLLRLFFERH